MSSNNKISNLINSQVPFFVRNDHRTFVAFLEAYYEYLEQTSTSLEGGKAIERRENMLNYMDIDKTLTEFEQNLYDKFLKNFPTNIQADKRVIMKHAKDIFRAKGTEKSVRFMLRAMFGDAADEVEFYYPKNDILRASDGKWFIQRSLRVGDVIVGNAANNDITGLEKFATTRITGNVSAASAIVERVDRFYTQGVLRDELVLSSIAGTFVNGEQVFSLFTDTDGVVKSVTANVQGGVISSLTINNPGTKYTTEDDVVIVSATGQNAVIRIAKVSTGNIAAITVLNGGAGYQNNNFLIITGGGGSGANGYVSPVDTSGTVHPNSYNIAISTISLEGNTTIGNLTYSNLMIGTGQTYNAYNAVAQTVSYFTYSNTGPATAIVMNTVGSGFIGVPDIQITANDRVKTLGILGRMQINDGGQNYRIGNIIEFNNIPGGSGYGANAIVANVNTAASNTITSVQFVQGPAGTLIGGSGYDMSYLPTANVVTTTGNGANISVTALLGYGGEFSVANSTIGAIERVIIENPGVGYDVNTTIDLTGSGDGTANITASVFEGVITYPGRYLNDDGFLSSSNYLEDRDYYQIFSYVIRVKESIANYRQALKEITHPAGFKMFGEYLTVDESENVSTSEAATDTGGYLTNRATYISGNNLVINYTNHGRVANDRVYLEFQTGNLVSNGATVANISGEFVVKTTINANAFIVYSSTKTIGTLNVNSFDTVPSGLHIKDDGMRLYFIGFSQDRIREYSMSRPFDITSATFVRSSPTFPNDATATDLEFKPDGTRVYITGDSNNTIYQLRVDEVWNASSINVTSGVLSYNVNAYETQPGGLRFNPSGNMMYVLGITTDRFWQFSLSESWNIATASLFTQSNTAISTREGSPTDFLFTNNGSSILVIGQTSDRIQLYNLGQAYNVNTIYFVANTSNLNILNPTGMEFSNDGKVLYVVDDNDNSIIQLPLSEAYNVFTAPVYYSTANTRAPSGNINFTRIVT